jgi:hypothetical protein
VSVPFDQGTPVPLKQELTFDVSTVFELGWATLENGELLTQAEDKGFDILLTTDKNLKYQQNLSSRSIGIIVLSTTSWPRIQKVAHEIETAIRDIDIGGFVEIHIP